MSVKVLAFWTLTCYRNLFDNKFYFKIQETCLDFLKCIGKPFLIFLFKSIEKFIVNSIFKMIVKFSTKSDKIFVIN